MAWFKTDDKLPAHRKARAVRKSHPSKQRDVAPFGIWVLAGAWSDDGFVPLEVLEEWDDDAKALADRLVRARMWHATSRDGEPGYIFHDWHDQNPAKDDNDPSSAGTFGNHVKWHVQREMVKPGCPHCPAEPDSSADDRPDIAPISPPDIGGIGGESLPSRPVPTRPKPVPITPLSDKPDETPNRFDEFWDAYDHKVGRRKAEAAYRAALKKPGITDALLIAAAAHYVDWVKRDGKHPQFTKHPTTWLNGECWRDERVERTAPQSRPDAFLAAAQRLHANEQAQMGELA